MKRALRIKEELRAEIYNLTKAYLTRHPEQAFQMALDATDLISSRASSTMLIDWRGSLENIADKEKSRKAYRIPTTTRAKSVKSHRKTRRAKSR